jgi:hypothetical protein
MKYDQSSCTYFITANSKSVCVAVNCAIFVMLKTTS